jgi:hypothetical protein
MGKADLESFISLKRERNEAGIRQFPSRETGPRLSPRPRVELEWGERRPPGMRELRLDLY